MNAIDRVRSRVGKRRSFGRLLGGGVKTIRRCTLFVEVEEKDGALLIDDEINDPITVL